MILALDFDDVLCDSKNVKHGFRMGEPVEGAQNAMVTLHQAGHEMIVHTVRGDRPKHVEDWLKHFKMPFLLVTNKKLTADWYVDNKGLRFHDWAQVLGEIL